MPDSKEKLKKFDAQKLIDIVKNYIQYGYDTEIRNAAIEILGERGISVEDLKLSGNFENAEFKSAVELLEKYNKTSKLAFLFYGLSIITNVLGVAFLSNSALISSLMTIVSFLSVLLFLVFLVVSLLNQNAFFKAIDQESAMGDQLVYIFVGMPLYIFVYFYYKNKMKEEMKLIK